jgi:hypothetical protein
MAQSALNLHSGGHLVALDELRQIKAPPPEGRWKPVSHAAVLDRVTTTLTEAGYEIRDQKLAVARDGARFFGTLDLSTPLATGVSLAVGVRNSTDKSFPLGFCAGSRVFVCSNLAFRSELLVKRKHTTFGEQRFAEGIATAVASLGQFKEMEQTRIRTMMDTEIGPDLADALILRAFDRGIISTHHLPKVIKEWREPEHDDFQPRTLWSLFNCFTACLRERATTAPQRFVIQTMRLNALLNLKTTSNPELALAT